MPGSLSLNDIGTGRSEIRNKVIARVFKEIGLIEQWGTGINKIIRLCAGKNLKPPEFKEHGSFFQVSFHKAETPISGISEELNEGLSEGLNSLYLAIRKNPGIRAKDIQQILEQRPIKTIERQIMELIKKKLIERRGSRKTGGYFAK
jgi:ATP-dependent DNA helicase RecG